MIEDLTQIGDWRLPILRLLNRGFATARAAAEILSFFLNRQSQIGNRQFPI